MVMLSGPMINADVKSLLHDHIHTGFDQLPVVFIHLLRGKRGVGIEPPGQQGNERA